ncbi:MAG: response regulator [Rhizobiales bacterium]|nr:response regulator [Hyphomicrobiales bacterium]
MTMILPSEIAALRRYGALLIGSKQRADDHLECVLGAVENSADDLYRLFHAVPLPGAELRLDDFAASDHRLLVALHKLAADDRALLLLTAMAGLGCDRVAAILGRIVSNVPARLMRACSLMQASCRNRLCMIVEDDRITLRDLQAEVTDRQLGVAGIARSRTEAFELTDQIRPDIAFIDLALPEGATAGADIAEHLRDRFATRIVFVTAFAGLAKALMRSGDMIVPKPWASGSLRQAISTATA